jgi:hypothetical protein
VVEVAASSSKYARSGRNFKLNVFFGWFWVSFRNTSIRSGSRQYNADIDDDHHLNQVNGA